MKKAFLVFACLLLLSACGGMRYIYMAEVNPTPNVDIINPIKERIFLEIDESVQDTFWEYHSDLKPLEISSWRSSLANGFMNTFSEFNIVTTKDKAQIIFRIYEATPVRTLVSLSAEGSYGLKTAVQSCQITYKVRLLDAQGKILKRSNGTAHSKQSGATKYDTNRIVASAIESMYESIVKNFFQEVQVK
ncbi:MAG: hypothetical protein FD159_340 [Syntrophaceae bacterium]|nr:MAG: hypothetical protein FD159_340 [Syntrophaceae bacterium]